MAPYCRVHVSKGRYYHELFDGDILKLRELLPGLPILEEFEPSKQIQLTAEEALELLEELQGLELSAEAGKRRYSRTTNGSVFRKLRELVGPFAHFLQIELRYLHVE